MELIVNMSFISLSFFLFAVITVLLYCDRIPGAGGMKKCPI